MSQPGLRIDFIESRGRIALVPAMVLACGVIALSVTVLQWREAAGRVEELRLRIDDRQRVRQERGSGDQEDAAIRKAAGEIAVALAVPWDDMLRDLESAGIESKSEVALLGIEPDRAHGRVTITAETRSLPAALEYLKRLQDRPAVRNALLLSHEIQDKSADRPVRVQIAAEWGKST